MKAPLLGLFLSLLAANAFAANVVTRKGEVLTDAKVSRVEADGVGFTHSNGSAFVDFDDLPSDLQKQYGWTPEKSQARQSARAQAAAKQVADAKAASQARAQAERDRQRAESEAAAKKEAEIVQREQSEKSARQWKDVQRLTLQILAVVGIAVFYFLPSIVGRNKKNAQAIRVLNILAGWTFVGWVIAMVWALTKDSAPQQVIVTQVVHAPPPQPRAIPQPRPVAQARSVPQPRAIQPPNPIPPKKA